MADKENDIRPCICCHNGCFNLSKANGTANMQSLSETKAMCRCAVNPESMNSKKYKLKPTTNPKRIAIIGGGIGGMETARVLTLRGHKATIFEKSNRLGGIFNEAAAFEFKEKDKALLAWYEKQIKDLNIEVKYNTEIKDVSKLDYDDVIIATGAKPKRLNIDGIDKAIEAASYLASKSQAKGKVIIIGGSLTGCEIAYELYNNGYEVAIVEMQNDLIPTRGVCLANSFYLRDYFKLKKVEVHLNTTVTKNNRYRYYSYF